MLALLDQLACALQFIGVAAYQCAQLALEVDAPVLRLLFLLAFIQAEQGGEADAGGAVGFLHAEQWQGVQRRDLLAERLELALDIAQQLAAPLADEALACMHQFQQA